jgi:hypothetical protein
MSRVEPHVELVIKWDERRARKCVYPALGSRLEDMGAGVGFVGSRSVGKWVKRRGELWSKECCQQFGGQRMSQTWEEKSARVTQTIFKRRN